MVLTESELIGIRRIMCESCYDDVKSYSSYDITWKHVGFCVVIILTLGLRRRLETNVCRQHNSMNNRLIKISM